MVFDKILTIGRGKLVKELNSVVDKINNLEKEFKEYSDDEIKSGFQSLRKKVEENVFLAEIEGFAYVREAAKRKLNQRHYDVQLFGGLVLLRNKIADESMKTFKIKETKLSLEKLMKKGSQNNESSTHSH